MKKIKLKTFLQHFYFSNKRRKNKKYCFILGAGASKQSGIPTGAELVKDWMSELTELYDADELEQWKKNEKISDNNLAENYSAIFDKRFALDKKEGYEFLETLMEGIDPSCGYSVLAQILASTNHNIVITTNFDSLTEDALFIYTRKKPLVIGHEALAHYIDLFLARPVVVKIHRDLYLSPKNTKEETNKLEKSFGDNLANIFKYYTPIVIGYGGNDGSLMGFLNSLTEIEGGIFWFYRETGSGLSNTIKDLIKKFNGCCVPISGFDELMMQIGNKLEYGRMDKQIKEIAEQRAKTYKEQVEKATEEESTDPVTKKAISDMVSRGEKDWWYYERKASAEKDIDKSEQLYLEAINKLPNSHELLGNYAVLLYNIKKDYDKAEEYYRKALEIRPDDANYLGNYAILLKEVKKDYEKAEEYYIKSLDIEPNNANNLGNYAILLKEVKKDYDKAEEYYIKSLDIEPNNTTNLGNYAIFLNNVKKDYDKAEEYYIKVLDIEPNELNINANYSKFLIETNEIDKARKYIDKSFSISRDQYKEIDIELELWFYCYAVFFKEYKDAPKKIEELLDEGIKSPGWDLNEILAIAKEMNHPNYKKLCEYADLITKED